MMRITCWEWSITLAACSDMNRWIVILCVWLIGAVSSFSQERSDSLTVESLEEMGVDFTHDNRVVLLRSGKEKFDDMLAAISQARYYVHLEYFNFRNDSIGNVLFTLLAQKAREGVQVRALFDSFGNSSNSRPLKKHDLNKIRSAGIEIYAFDPIVFPWINHALHRDHRKIVIIDGKMVYTGGMNVADYYIYGKPEFGEWRDMHMRIEGGVVEDYEEIFSTMWEKTTGGAVPEDSLFAEDMRKDTTAYTGLKPDTCLSAGHKMVGVVDRVPIIRPKIMRRSYQYAIDHARYRVQIINPYLTLVRSVRKALYRALERGVRVEIMVSTKSDVKIVPDVVAYNVHKLMKRGAEIYYYETGFHHTKVMMVDDSFCTVGSANLNSRSLTFDYEVNAFIMDSCTTHQLQYIFEEDKKKSTLLTPENWKQRRNVWQRFKGWFFQILVPLI
jgi:cardiolipin synthase